MNGYKIERFNEIDSTNTYIKSKREQQENLIVTAKTQTGGRGTKGRSFSSAQGGVYLSKLDFYQNFPAKDSFLIMARAAVSVCKTLEEFGVQPKIKWANDVFVNKKKICGILIENVFSGNQLSSSVVGVGVNVCNILPSELQEIATSLKEVTGKTYDPLQVEERLIFHLCEPYNMDEYRKYIGFLGEEVTLIFGEVSKKATLLFVENDGALWVQTQDGKEKFYAAEVSLRI